jgi:hypothetical protein
MKLHSATKLHLLELVLEKLKREEGCDEAVGADHPRSSKTAPPLGLLQAAGSQ